MQVGALGCDWIGPRTGLCLPASGTFPARTHAQGMRPCGLYSQWMAIDMMSWNAGVMVHHDPALWAVAIVQSRGACEDLSQRFGRAGMGSAVQSGPFSATVGNHGKMHRDNPNPSR